MRKQSLKYLALYALLLVLALECFLRWGVGLGDPPLARLDPLTEYELVPAKTYSRWGNSIEINAFGMRAPEHPVLPEKNERHLLLIGDSVVYGGHFLDQSEIISAHLDQLLNSEPRLAGCRIRVFPMAVSSWGPVNQAAALQKYGTFGASAVGIIVSAHDLYDTPTHSVDIVPYRTSVSRTAIGDAVQAVVERLPSSSQVQVERATPATRAQFSLSALDDIADTLQEQNVRLVLVYHPTTMERAGQARNEKNIFLAWAEARKVDTLDLGSVPINEGDYRDHIHPAQTGAKHIARALFPTFSERLSSCPDAS